MAGGDFDHCLDLLRQSDRDRYLACLLVPEEHRAGFAALYAFNAEIARVRDIVHDPMPGEIRLQWWRDLINGTPHGGSDANPVAAALMTTIERYRLPREGFDRYIEARTFDLYDDPMPDRTSFEGYAGETVSALMQMSVLMLSPDDASAAAEVCGHAGVALAVAGAMLLMPIHRRRNQVYVPGDLLAATGMDAASFLRGEDKSACRRAVMAFADLGNDHLSKARAILPETAPRIFPAVSMTGLAAPILDRTRRAGADILDTGLTIAQWRRQWWLWRAMRRNRF